MTLVDARIAVDLHGVSFLCGDCTNDEAFVVVSPTSTSWYGHCAICEHTVFLGTHGKAWFHGREMTVLL